MIQEIAEYDTKLIDQIEQVKGRNGYLQNKS